jgi:hypothetical protein
MSTCLRQLVIAIALMFAVACGFSGSGANNFDAVDAESSPNSPDAQQGCTCTNGNELTCGDVVSVCALGCTSTGTPRCLDYQPSNGASWTIDLNGVTTDLVVSDNTTFNTDTGQFTGGISRDAGPGVIDGVHFRIHADIAVIGVKSMDIQAGKTLLLIGSLPAIFVVSEDVSIEGVIDASADTVHPGPGGGVGAQSASTASGCSAGGNGGQGDARYGGGAGGAFGEKSGKGGSTTYGAVESLSCADALSAKLNGGSGGGRGGGTANGGNGGAGGGAVQISSRGTIVFGNQGGIRANGGGGLATAEQVPVPVLDKGYGGGGGGAGGGILIEAPVIELNGVGLYANGGGGGSGSKTGRPGNDGGLTTSAAAKGGKGQCGGSNCGGGGDGGVYTMAATAGVGDSTNGGGGGGGSVGKIEIRQRTNRAAMGSISPVPLANVLVTF